MARNLWKFLLGRQHGSDELQQQDDQQQQNAAHQQDDQQASNPFLEFAPPGHFYSPLPDVTYIDQNKERLFDRQAKSIPGIEVDADLQLTLAEKFSTYYHELPFQDEKAPGLRYYFHNDWFSYGDAIVLYSMLRHLRPQRIIEVGSGFSSAVMLDTNDLFLAKGIAFTFVEPNPERLFSLLTDEDKTRCEIIVDVVQELPLERFDVLQAKDILFIDSSHVAKIGSDVVHLLTNVLPRLNKGVIIHIHDIFWPFEYPEVWLAQGRAWNELYMLKAFLQFTTHFKIWFFNSYLATHHLDAVGQSLPLFVTNPGGSIWLEKIA